MYISDGSSGRIFTSAVAGVPAVVEFFLNSGCGNMVAVAAVSNIKNQLS